MAASAYNTTITVKNSKGNLKQYTLTCDDVSGNSYTFASGQSQNILSSNDAYITDFVISNTTGATDAKYVHLYINSVDTGLIIFPNAHIPTAFQRPIMSCPIYVPAGANVQFKQSTS